MPYYRNIAEIITGGDEKDNPGNAARDVVKGETAIAHVPYAGHKGGESADNRDEAGQKNGFATVFLVEFVGSIEVLLFEETGGFAMKDAGTDEFSQGIINRISGYGGDDEHNNQQPGVQNSERSNSAQGKKERIPRKDGGNNQACFAKNNQENNYISPDTEKLDNRV